MTDAMEFFAKSGIMGEVVEKVSRHAVLDPCTWTIDGKRLDLPFNIIVDHYCPPCGSLSDPAAQEDIEWHLECWDGSPCDWVEENLTANGCGQINEMALSVMRRESTD